MQAVEFPEQTQILAKDQPQYQPIPIHYDPKYGAATSCFQLSDEEVEEIVRTRRIWNTQVTFGNPYHPIRMSVSKPDF